MASVLCCRVLFRKATTSALSSRSCKYCCSSSLFRSSNLNKIQVKCAAALNYPNSQFLQYKEISTSSSQLELLWQRLFLPTSSPSQLVVPPVQLFLQRLDLDLEPLLVHLIIHIIHLIILVIGSFIVSLSDVLFNNIIQLFKPLLVIIFCYIVIFKAISLLIAD